MNLYLSPAQLRALDNYARNINWDKVELIKHKFRQRGISHCTAFVNSQGIRAVLVQRKKFAAVYRPISIEAVDE